MARHKHEHEHENHERWLISYADFITLLFAFFVVMFASSQADKSKAKAVSESVTEAFEGPGAVAKIAAAIAGKPHEQSANKAAGQGEGDGGKQELSHSLDTLVKDLKQEIEAGKIGVSMEARGLVVSLQQSAFFPSGEDTLLPGALTSMDKIALVIGKLPNQIRLEGHTDAIPISNGRFRSNWELSSARGLTVLEWLETRHRISSRRMAIVAYADTIAKGSNDTEEGRARNRRVDITILNENGVKHEATPAPTGNKTAHAPGHA
jgi:chemotaxis protein MotB